MGKTFFSCEVFPLGMLNRRLNVNVSKSLERLTLYQTPLPMRAHTLTCTHTRGQSPLQISARAPQLFGDEGARRRQSWGCRGPASPPPRSAFQPLPRQRWGSGMQQGAEAVVVPGPPTRQCPSYTGHAAGAAMGAGDAPATAGPPRSRTRPGALRAGRSAGIALRDRAASISQ